jgi:hypothetical protein
MLGLVVGNHSACDINFLDPGGDVESWPSASGSSGTRKMSLANPLWGEASFE